MRCEVFVPALDRDEAVPETRETLLRERERFGVPVDPDDAHAGRGLEEGFRVAAEAERRVDEDAAALRPEGLDDLPEEDGDVTRACSFHGGRVRRDGVRVRRSPHP